MFTRISIVGFCFLTATVAGAAANGTGAPYASPSMDQTFDWEGFYAGGSFTRNFGDLDLAANQQATTGNVDEDLWEAGLFAGYRWHPPGNIVYGAELEVPVYWETGTAEDIVFYPRPAFNPPVIYEAEGNWGFFVKGQVGYAIRRCLAFIEGGIGLVNVTGRTLNVDNNDVYTPGFVQEDTNTHVAYKIGVGIDYALTDNLIVGARYHYFGLSKENYEMSWNQPPPNPFSASANAVSVALTYKFLPTLVNGQ